MQPVSFDAIAHKKSQVLFVLQYAHSMAFNTSQRQRASAVLQSKLEDFEGWDFGIQCGKCRHHRLLPVKDLLVLYRSDTKIMRLVNRLRCSTPGCGAAPGRVVIQNRLHEVVLVGQGAYG